MVPFKRFSALILMLALIVPMLAACGGGTTGGAATTVPAPGEAATTAPAPGEAATTAPAPGGEQPTAAGGAAQPTAPAAGGAMAEGATAGSSGDVTKIAVEDGATLRVAVAGNATEQKLYQEGLDRFGKLFPNVKLTLEPIPDQYETTMKAGFSGGTAQDVFLLNGELMGAFGPNGLLLPLDDAMSTAGMQTSDYYELLLTLFQQDGKTYGLPKDFGALVVFINDEMAQKAGVDPASIKTWTDLQDASMKMTAGEGPAKTYGMCLNPDIQRYGASMLQNGNLIIQDGKAVFNQPNGVAALEFWYSFKQNGSGELYKELGKGWCGEAFSGRNAAMVVEGGWLIPFLSDPANGATDLKYTAIPLPTPEGGQPATWLFTNAFGVNAKTQYPNAAAALVLYLTGAQNQQALIPSGLALPSLQSLASDPYFQENPAQKVLVEQGETGQLADFVLGGALKKGDVINILNKDAFEPVFLGAASPKDALDAAALKIDEVMQR